MGGKGYHVSQVNATCENHAFKPWAWQDTTRIWRLTCRRNMTWPLMWLSIWYETMALEHLGSGSDPFEFPRKSHTAKCVPDVCLRLGKSLKWSTRTQSKVGISQSCHRFHRWKAQHAVMCLWDANRWDDKTCFVHEKFLPFFFGIQTMNPVLQNWWRKKPYECGSFFVSGSRSGLYKHYRRLYEGAAATTGYPYLEAEVRYAATWPIFCFIKPLPWGEVMRLLICESKLHKRCFF